VCDVPWDILYYKLAEGSIPAEDFLDAIPTKVEARLLATLDAVAAAPPPQFSGGGMWEAMHGTMGGWYEIRCTGPGREQFRLFCVLENGTPAQLIWSSSCQVGTTESPVFAGFSCFLGRVG